MRMFLAILGIVLVVSTVPAQKKPKMNGLKDLVVILDPGHGGTDPGASRFLGKKRVTEDEYVYDVALRVEALLRKKRAMPFLTIRDKEGIRSAKANQIFSDERDETFALNQKLVSAKALSARVAYAKKIRNQYSGRKVWVSIHFDVVGTRRDVDGVRIIYGDGSLPLARALEKSFGKVGRLREAGSLAQNGDPRYGLRRLYVLRHNPLQNKVLVELGNFNNDHDFWRIRDPKVRQNYAEAIVAGLSSL